MKIRIGSRTSKLALKQVEIAMKRIGVPSFEIIGVDTAGDKSSRENKVQFDKKNFVEDIDNLLVDKKIDIAIHSAKDMPAVSNISDLDEIYISNDLVQSDEKYNSRNDILIFRKNEHPVFKKNMKIGTSSLRRKLQSKFFLEATEIDNLNGNVDTRIKKLNDGEYDCIILAKAGCERLELDLNYSELEHLTSISQGSICLRFNKKSGEILKLLKPFNDNEMKRKIKECNNFLNLINADCNSAVAVDYKDEVLQAEVYGKKEFISFSALNAEEAFMRFQELDGLRLLNEHS
ncbi:MAG: hydroxymethylbilane synthase [Gammaproteobacteria bacterium]